MRGRCAVTGATLHIEVAGRSGTPRVGAERGTGPVGSDGAASERNRLGSDRLTQTRLGAIVLYVTALLPLATSGRAVIAVGVVSAIVLLVIVLRTES